MNVNGLLIGCGAFLMIGAFHPLVVKSEYHFGKHIWPLFALLGIAALGCSLFLRGTVPSALAAVFGVSCLWSILELFEQEERVKKGWFPENPKKKG